MKAIFLIAGMSVIAAAPALAMTAPAAHAKRTSTLTIKGSVSTACSLTTSSFTFTIGIGYIHAPGNAILKQNMLAVRCTKGASTKIAMNTGLYGSAAGVKFGSRSMKDSSGDVMGYELCHDNACSAIWTPQGYNYVSPGDRGSALPVWTRILTGQPHVNQGSYSDSVTVTINF